MARTPMVTRTVTTTKATVLCVDINAEATCIKEVEVPRTYTKDDKLLQAIETGLEAEPSIKPVKVISTEIVETLYGMSEQKFIDNAEKLPPRTKTEQTTDENAQD